MPKDNKSAILIDMATGSISGAIECICVWPMEYIKTQLQLQRKLPLGEKPPFTGIISGLTYTARTTGFLSLYKGLSITLVGSFPKAGIRFGGNSWCKKMLQDENGKLTMASNFLAGMGAG